MSVRVYFERQAQTLLGELGRMASAPFATLMIMSVIGVALALPLCFHLFIQNARELTSHWSPGMETSVYLKPEVAEQEANRVAAQIRARPDVAEIALIPPAAGLAEFKKRSGFGPALDALTSNPLPFVIVVTPALSANTSAGLEARTQSIASMPAVAFVQADSQWVRRWYAILDAMRRAGGIFFVVLGSAVALVIGSTVRLDILSRRHEVEVMKLVGGTDRFVRRPFLYAGMLQGLGGALIALVLLALIQHALAGPIESLANAYGSHYRLQGLDWRIACLVVAAAAVLGWLGSWISAQRHIRAIEPT